LFEEIDYLLCIYGFTSTEPFKRLVTINHTEDIEPLGPLRRDIDVFFWKFPSVRDIAFAPNMGFICIEEVDFFFGIKPFKFLQLLCLIFIELRRGCTLGTFSYTSISCAKADKKRLKTATRDMN
jgi:hypothetical protein